MHDKYIAAIDQGTTGTRCAIFGKEGKIAGWAYIKHRQIFPAEGFVEHNPLEILHNSRYVLKKAVENAHLQKSSILSVGISNQRETVVAWNTRTGLPVYNAIVWQDTRTKDYISGVKKGSFSDRITAKTGLNVSTYFSASKIKWIMDHSTKFRSFIKRGESAVGTMDSWLMWNLTGKKNLLTDYTNASRTMLMNLRKLEWDADLLDFFKIPESILPDIISSMPSESFGYIEDKGFNGIPISSDMGDQQAALFGERCLSNGDTKITYGTGSFVLQNTGINLAKPRNGLISTCAYGTEDGKCHYAIEGSSAVSGSLFDWLMRIGLLKSFNEISSILKEGRGSALYLVPAFSGLFSPYWDESARGLLIGLTSSSSRKDIIKAAAYSVCLQVAEIIKSMHYKNGRLNVDGGVSANNEIMQLQADLLGNNIYRSSLSEASVFGAALSAGLSSGYWDIKLINELEDKGTFFRPRIKKGDREEIYSKWLSAVKRSRGWF